MSGFASLKISLEVAKTGGRSDFVEALVYFETGETALKTQVVEQRREIGVRRVLENIAAKAGKPIVDVLHAGRRRFVIEHDPPRLVDHIAAIPASFIAKHRHERGLVARLKRAPDGCEFHRQKRIAVDDEEALVEHAFF